MQSPPNTLYIIALPPTVGYLNVCKKDIKRNKLQQHSHKNRNVHHNTTLLNRSYSREILTLLSLAITLAPASIKY